MNSEQIAPFYRNNCLVAVKSGYSKSSRTSELMGSLEVPIMFIAVTTDKGVHIHNSEDLSLYRVLAAPLSTAIKWSNDGLSLRMDWGPQFGI